MAPLMAGQPPVVVVPGGEFAVDLQHRIFLTDYAVSCELGLIETTGPTGGTQHREHWGGPTNGQAAACRRRLAAAPMDGSIYHALRERPTLTARALLIFFRRCLC